MNYIWFIYDLYMNYIKPNKEQRMKQSYRIGSLSAAYWSCRYKMPV